MHGPLFLVVILAAIVYGSRRGVPLGVSLLAGSWALLVTSGFGLADSLTALVWAASRPESLTLALVVLGIAQLGRMMSHSGAFTQLLDDARGVVRRSATLVGGIPALLGMLTIPGGAIMSAAMVNEVGDELGMRSVEKAACNIVFRHLWYFVYLVHPMYALIESISGVPLLRLFVLGLFPGILSWAVAYHTCVPPAHAQQSLGGSRWRALARLSHSALPILVVAVGRGVLRLNFLAVIAVALLVAAFYGVKTRQPRELAQHALSRLARRPDLLLGLAALGVMVFQMVLVQTGVAQAVATLIAGYGIPLPLAALVIPLSLGLFSGSTFAAVGMSLSLFIGLLPPAAFDRYVVFIYVAALAGYMISPIHLCLVLSCEFFGVDHLQVVRKLLPALGALVGAAGLLLVL